MDGICPGSCNTRHRKNRALYAAECAPYQKKLDAPSDGDEVPEAPEAPAVHPWYGDPVWCTRCQSAIRNELHELDYLAAMLAALPPGIRPAVTGQREHVKVSGTREHESPSPAVEELDDLALVLREWESAGRVHRVYLHGPHTDSAHGADPAPRHGYLATEITTVLSWLIAHFDPMITDPEMALDYGTAIRLWHRRLTASTNAAHAARHQKRPCPRCKLYTLWWNLGEDYIRCINEDCNRVMTRAEYQDMAADVA